MSISASSKQLRWLDDTTPRTEAGRVWTPTLQMGTPQDPGAVFNMLWAGNNQLFSEIAAQFPDGAATAFTVGVGLAMLAGQCALSAYFSFIATSGPWHAMPGFTAHQLIYCERLTCPAAPTPHHTPLSATAPHTAASAMVMCGDPPLLIRLPLARGSPCRVVHGIHRLCGLVRLERLDARRAHPR